MRLVVLLLSLVATILCKGHSCNVSNDHNEEFIRKFGTNDLVCQTENGHMVSNRLYCNGVLCWLYSYQAICHHYTNDTWTCSAEFHVESNLVKTEQLTYTHIHGDMQEWKSFSKDGATQYTIVCPIDENLKIRSRTCAMVVDLSFLQHFIVFLQSKEFCILMIMIFSCADQLLARGNRNENRIYAIEAPREIKKVTDYKPNIPLDEPEENEELCCLICKDNKKTWCAQNCGHIVACNACFQDYRKRKECPLCRQYVEFWVAVRI